MTAEAVAKAQAQAQSRSLMQRIATSLPFRWFYRYWAWFPWNRLVWTPEERALPLNERPVPFMFWPWALVGWVLIFMALFVAGSATYHALLN